MPPLLDDHVVSPELALVDADLAARARALPDSHAQRRVLAAAMPPVAVAPAPRPARRGDVPARTLLATAAVCLVVTAVTGAEQASGDSPVARGAPEPVAPAAAPAPASASETTRVTASAQPAGDDTFAGGSPDGPQSVLGFSTPRSAGAAPRTVSDAARAGRVAVSATTLVWPGSRSASAYDLELVRDGSVIFTSRSPSPRAVVPRSWERAGVTYAVQPEDQVFVWSVVAGHRAAPPVVNGVLALDMTHIARLIEQSQSGARP